MINEISYGIAKSFSLKKYGCILRISGERLNCIGDVSSSIPLIIIVEQYIIIFLGLTFFYFYHIIIANIFDAFLKNIQFIFQKHNRVK